MPPPVGFPPVGYPGMDSPDSPDKHGPEFPPGIIFPSSEVTLLNQVLTCTPHPYMTPYRKGGELYGIVFFWWSNCHQILFLCDIGTS
jgi:hypothetical protein